MRFGAKRGWGGLALTSTTVSAGGARASLARSRGIHRRLWVRALPEQYRDEVHVELAVLEVGKPHLRAGLRISPCLPRCGYGALGPPFPSPSGRRTHLWRRRLPLLRRSLRRHAGNAVVVGGNLWRQGCICEGTAVLRLQRCAMAHVEHQTRTRTRTTMGDFLESFDRPPNFGRKTGAVREDHASTDARGNRRGAGRQVVHLCGSQHGATQACASGDRLRRRRSPAAVPASPLLRLHELPLVVTVRPNPQQATRAHKRQVGQSDRLLVIDERTRVRAMVAAKHPPRTAALWERQLRGTDARCRCAWGRSRWA